MDQLQHIACALGGEVCGRQVLAPGPGHTTHDRSLSVCLAPNDPDGFTVHSFANDDWRHCKQHVRERLGMPPRTQQLFWRATKQAHVCIEPAPNDAARTQHATKLFFEASRLLNSTPAVLYLRKRQIDIDALPERLHEALRWHPSCPWGNGYHGCMVALFTDCLTREPKAIHRTAITGAGEKVGRKALGPIKGCVIRLWPDDAVTLCLVLGEGIETTLAAATCVQHRGTLLAPAWAAGNEGLISRFPVLAGVEALTLLVDNDRSGSGQRAALECSRSWTAAGREVIRLLPRVTGADFNDLVGMP